MSPEPKPPVPGENPPPREHEEGEHEDKVA